MHISFVKLGHEECEQCEHFYIHPHKKDDLKEDCEECQAYKSHIKLVEDTRVSYKEDAAKVWEE
ncbi:hypothetical protein J6590_100087, partial [Homalodisca vitripennis]